MIRSREAVLEWLLIVFGFWPKRERANGSLNDSRIKFGGGLRWPCVCMYILMECGFANFEMEFWGTYLGVAGDIVSF